MELGNLNPAFLPPGTQVGPWRVLEQRGRGTYGAVYRAEHADAGEGPVALKLALHPGDARFAREVELLSRIRHPAVPGLRGHGHWQHREGAPYPYPWLAMELVEGTPLYDWARAQRPTSRQVLQLLARLTRALEATHAVGAVHRDVKGSNVLVRHADGQAFLIDFGAGHHQGAAALTYQPFPPGTPAYRSPEAWRFARSLLGRVWSKPYAPAPSDDVFALGVTAYRLITQRYPPSPPPEQEAPRLWRKEAPGARSPGRLNGRCGPELDALVSRMLSPRPQARGSARALAEALERAVRSAGPRGDVPLFTGDEPRADDIWPDVRPPEIRPPRKVRVPWLAVASVGVTLAVGVDSMLAPSIEEAQAEVQDAEAVEAKDGGTVAVGDSVLTAPVSSTRTPSAWSAIALDMPPKPFPGQLRPNAGGHCPGKLQVPINGGCWLRLLAEPGECKEDAYVHKNGCYVPVFPPTRPTTSSPASCPAAP